MQRKTRLVKVSPIWKYDVPNELWMRWQQAIHGWRQSSNIYVHHNCQNCVARAKRMYVCTIYVCIFANWSILIKRNDKQIAENHGGRPEPRRRDADSDVWQANASLCNWTIAMGMDRDRFEAERRERRAESRERSPGTVGRKMGAR